MAQVEAGFTPVKRFTVVGGYAHLDAMEPYAVNPYHAAGSVNPAMPAAGVFGSRLGRGQLAKARVVYQLTPSVQGYINLEKFMPRDFYQARNSGYWFRAEVVYRFKGFVGFWEVEGEAGELGNRRWRHDPSRALRASSRRYRSNLRLRQTERLRSFSLANGARLQDDKFLEEGGVREEEWRRSGKAPTGWVSL